MARLSPVAMGRQRLDNALQATLMLIAMAGLAGLVGFLLAGFLGSLIAVLGGLIMGLLTPLYTPWFILRIYSAIPLAPEQAPAIHRMLRALAERAELEAVPELYYVPSQVANALTVGGRRNSALAVTDGLLRRLDARQLAGVLAHEIAHVRNGDLHVMGMADTFSRTTTYFSLIGLILILFSLPFADSFTILAGLVLALAPALMTLLQSALSRSREFAADLGAVELTGDIEGLILALETIEGRPSFFFQRLLGLPGRDPNPSLLRTHPALPERIARLRALVTRARRPALDMPTVFHTLDRLSEVEQPPRLRFWGNWY